MKKLFRKIGLSLATLACAVCAGVGISLSSSQSPVQADTTVTESVSTDFWVASAGIRLVNDTNGSGIRFHTNYDLDAYAEIEDSIAETGTLIIPEVRYDGELTLADLDNEEYKRPAQGITTGKWYDFDRDDDGTVDYKRSTVYLYDLPASMYGARMIAVSYVKTTEGNVYYTEASPERSITDVANVVGSDSDYYAPAQSFKVNNVTVTYNMPDGSTVSEEVDYGEKLQGPTVEDSDGNKVAYADADYVIMNTTTDQYGRSVVIGEYEATLPVTIDVKTMSKDKLWFDFGEINGDGSDDTVLSDATVDDVVTGWGYQTVTRYTNSATYKQIFDSGRNIANTKDLSNYTKVSFALRVEKVECSGAAFYQSKDGGGGVYTGTKWLHFQFTKNDDGKTWAMSVNSLDDATTSGTAYTKSWTKVQPKSSSNTLFGLLNAVNVDDSIDEGTGTTNSYYNKTVAYIIHKGGDGNYSDVNYGTMNLYATELICEGGDPEAFTPTFADGVTTMGDWFNNTVKYSDVTETVEAPVGFDTVTLYTNSDASVKEVNVDVAMENTTYLNNATDVYFALRLAKNEGDPCDSPGFWQSGTTSGGQGSYYGTKWVYFHYTQTDGVWALHVENEDGTFARDITDINPTTDTIKGLMRVSNEKGYIIDKGGTKPTDGSTGDYSAIDIYATEIKWVCPTNAEIIGDWFGDWKLDNAEADVSCEKVTGVEIPAGYQTVTKHMNAATYKQIFDDSHNIANTMDLTGYTDVYFALRVEDGEKVDNVGSVSGFWQTTGGKSYNGTEWLYFHYTQTSDSVWKVNVSTADKTTYNQTYTKITPKSGAGNTIWGLMRANNVVGYIINKGGDNGLSDYGTMYLYATEVQGTRWTNADSVGGWFGSNVESTSADVEIPAGFTSVQKYCNDNTSAVNLNTQNKNTIESTMDLSTYSDVYFALRLEKVSTVDTNTPYFYTAKGASYWYKGTDWLYFHYTQTSDSVWTLNVYTADKTTYNQKFEGIAVAKNTINALMTTDMTKGYYLSKNSVTVVNLYATEVQAVPLEAWGERVIWSAMDGATLTTSKESGLKLPYGFKTIHQKKDAKLFAGDFAKFDLTDTKYQELRFYMALSTGLTIDELFDKMDTNLYDNVANEEKNTFFLVQLTKKDDGGWSVYMDFTPTYHPIAGDKWVPSDTKGYTFESYRNSLSEIFSWLNAGWNITVSVTEVRGVHTCVNAYRELGDGTHEIYCGVEGCGVVIGTADCTAVNGGAAASCAGQGICEYCDGLFGEVGAHTGEWVYGEYVCSTCGEILLSSSSSSSSETLVSTVLEQQTVALYKNATSVTAGETREVTIDLSAIATSGVLVNSATMDGATLDVTADSTNSSFTTSIANTVYGEKTIEANVTLDGVNFDISIPVFFVTSMIIDEEGFIGVQTVMETLGGDGYYMLGNDIELSSQKQYAIGYYYPGYSNYGLNAQGTPFNGTFDGNGYALKGYNNDYVDIGSDRYQLSSTDTNYNKEKELKRYQNSSLFGWVNGTIKNLAIIDVTLSRYGSIVGAGSGTLENVYIQAEFRTTSTTTDGVTTVTPKNMWTAAVWGYGQFGTGTMKNVVVDFTGTTVTDVGGTHYGYVFRKLDATKVKNVAVFGLPVAFANDIHYDDAADENSRKSSGADWNIYSKFSDSTTTQGTYDQTAWDTNIWKFVDGRPVLKNVDVSNMDASHVCEAVKYEQTGNMHQAYCSCGLAIGSAVACSGGYATNCVTKAVCTTCRNRYGEVGAHVNCNWSGDSYVCGDCNTTVASKYTTLDKQNVVLYTDATSIDTSDKVSAVIDLSGVTDVDYTVESVLLDGDPYKPTRTGANTIEIAVYPQFIYGEYDVEITVTIGGETCTVIAPVLVVTSMITKAEGLAGVHTVMSTIGGNGYYMLGNDIELTANTEYAIGYLKTTTTTVDGNTVTTDESVIFRGTFDGNGHAIDKFVSTSGVSDSNTTSGASVSYRNSIFGYTDGATIKNVAFTNMQVGYYNGIIARGNNTTVENVYVQVTSIYLKNNCVYNHNGLFFGQGQHGENKVLKNVVVDYTSVASLPTGIDWDTNNSRWNCFGVIGSSIDAQNVAVFGWTKGTFTHPNDSSTTLNLKDFIYMQRTGDDQGFNDGSGYNIYVTYADEDNTNNEANYIPAAWDTNIWKFVDGRPVLKNVDISGDDEVADIPEIPVASKKEWTDNCVVSNNATHYVLAVSNEAGTFEAGQTVVSAMTTVGGAPIYGVATLSDMTLPQIIIGSYDKYLGYLTDEQQESVKTALSGANGRATYGVYQYGNTFFILADSEDGFEMAAQAFNRELFGYTEVAEDSFTYTTDGTVAVPETAIDFTSHIAFDLRNADYYTLTSKTAMNFNVTSRGYTAYNGQYGHNISEYFESGSPYLISTYTSNSSVTNHNICFLGYNNTSGDYEFSTIVDIVANKIIAKAVEDSTITALNFMIADSSDYCTCEKCKTFANPSVTQVLFLNAVARKVNADGSDLWKAGRTIKIVFFAYGGYETAPVVTEANQTYIEDTLGLTENYATVTYTDKTYSDDTISKSDETVLVADENLVLYWTSAKGSHSYHLTDAINVNVYKGLQAWCVSVSPDNIMAWLYQTYFQDYFLPFNTWEYQVSWYNTLNSLGVHYYMSNEGQANTTAQTQTAFSAFKVYIDNRAMTDSSVTFEQLKQEFFGYTEDANGNKTYNNNGYYGAGGEYMHKFFEELVSYMEGKKNLDSTTYKEEYDPAVINAKAAAGTTITNESAVRKQTYFNGYYAAHYTAVIGFTSGNLDTSMYGGLTQLATWKGYCEEALTKVSDATLQHRINREMLFPWYAILTFNSTFALQNYTSGYENGLKPPSDYNYNDFCKLVVSVGATRQSEHKDFTDETYITHNTTCKWYYNCFKRWGIDYSTT